MLLTSTKQLLSKRQNVVIYREADFTGQTGTRAG